MSVCLSVRGAWPVWMSQSLTVKSPEAEARMFSAAGLKRTCPTFLDGRQFWKRRLMQKANLECPPNLLTGETSGTSSASVYSVNPSGTSQIPTLPSSEAEATMRSLKGFQSVSSTAAVCPLNNGMTSGNLPLSSKGMTAKAPPPEASQLTLKYSGLT